MSEGSETFTFTGVVDEKGHVKPDTVNSVRGRLAKWSGRKVTVVVRRYVKNKSNEQLALFHGPILDAWTDYTGYTHDEMKKELKRAYLVPALVISRLTGEEFRELPSLTDLTHEEMSTFLDRCIREGAHMGIEFELDRSSARI